MAIIEKDGQFIDTTPRPAERGQAIEWGWIQVGRDRSIGYTSHADVDDVKQCLQADAERELRPGTRYELRQRIPSNFGRTKGMAWYWCEAFDKDDGWGTVDAGPQHGYWLIGQFTTPLLLNVAPTASEIR